MQNILIAAALRKYGQAHLETAVMPAKDRLSSRKALVMLAKMLPIAADMTCSEHYQCFMKATNNKRAPQPAWTPGNAIDSLFWEYAHSISFPVTDAGKGIGSILPGRFLDFSR